MPKTLVLMMILGAISCADEARPADDGDIDANGDADNDSSDAGTDSDVDADIDTDTDADVDMDDTGDSSPTDADPDTGDTDVPLSPIGVCGDTPPPGAQAPDPIPAYSGGACPAVVTGHNELMSSGNRRELLVVLPEDHDPAERLPVIFMWHWLGGEASDFLEQGEVQQATSDLRFLAVIPEAKGDLYFKWPFLSPPLSSDARRDEELVFFDDMLACVAASFLIDESCVSSVGVSAGGLWTSHLAQLRSTHLASVLSLSGGVGPAGGGLIPVRPWTGAEHRLAALALWGGPTDFWGVDFATTSRNLERGLAENGHYLVECIHNCSHAQPPMNPPEGMSAFAGLWEFALSHPYWLADGTSPFLEAGLPAGLPAWCGQGMGSATIREGECEGGVLGDCL
jgi:hypothetical protein